MPQLNQVMFIGHLGQDPEMSYTPNGKPVTKFSLAVNQGKDAQGKDRKPMWFNVVTWNNLAEIVSNYAHKGASAFVQGRFDMREYTDKSGVNRIAYEVVATTVQLLDRKPQEAPRSSASDFSDLDENAPF